MLAAMPEQTIAWYRTRLEKEELRGLTKRSDLKGLMQALGHLLVVSATGFAVAWAWDRLAWPFVVIAFFLHGTVFAFLGGGGAFHELCHGTPFRTRWLNELFLWIYAFLSWSNFVAFRTSHTRHHLYTVHHGLDLEVVLPGRVRLRDLLWQLAFNPIGVYQQLRAHVRLSFGILEGEWEQRLFTGEGARLKPGLVWWARILLLGHAALAVLFVCIGEWRLILIVLTPFYAGWLVFLCAVPQHLGMQADVPDWRRSARTVLQGPITRFLYWRMNYHLEHHMYAAVPFHALGRLHRLIAHDTPRPNRGLLGAWREIISYARKQKVDPGYVIDPWNREKNS
jgi:fatty acid desaturase